MEKIAKEQYDFASKRIEELLPITEDSMDDPNMAELLIMSDIVERYEEEHFPFTPPTLAEVIEDAMKEKGINGKALAATIGVSPSQISGYLHGVEPTLQVARKLSSVLDIKPVEFFNYGYPSSNMKQ